MSSVVDVMARTTATPRLRIVADDLTGAADAGVAFASPERRVPLALREEATSWRDPSALVAVLDRADREAGANATRRNRLALAPAIRADWELFVKVDSTLRGHIAVALCAFREAFPERVALFAPAFPRLGRVTRGGVHFVDGVPLAQTRLWHAESRPPPASLAEALGDLPSVLLGLDTLRGASARLAAQLRLAARSKRVLCCDAERDEDLDALVTAAADLGSLCWIGSGGLASALARRRTFRGGGRWSTGTLPARSDVAVPCPTPRFVAVIGSLADVARRQAAALVATFAARLVEVPVELLAEHGAVLRPFAREISAQLRSASVVIVVQGPFARAATSRITQGLARLVAPAVASAPLSVLAGGATARSVLDHAGVSTL